MSQVVVLQTCLFHYLQKDLAAGVESRVTVVALVCCRVVTSDDGVLILHVCLEAMGVVQGFVFNTF